MRKSLFASTAAILALSFGAVACGSDDDNGDSGEAPSENALTRTELVAQADRICEDANQALNEAAENAFGNQEPSDEEVVSFISDEVVPHYEGQIEELRGLEPDADSADGWNNVVDTLASELGAVKDDPEGSVQSQDPFPESSAAAQDFGLKVCGSS